MIQIEGTSPPDTNDKKSKNENEPSILDVSNKIEKIIGQQSLETNDNLAKEDLNIQQDNKINSEIQQINEINNATNDVEAIKKSSSDEETKTKDKNKNSQTNISNDNEKEKENEEKLINENFIDNNVNKKDTNKSKDNKSEGDEDEKKTELTSTNINDNEDNKNLAEEANLNSSNANEAENNENDANKKDTNESEDNKCEDGENEKKTEFTSANINDNEDNENNNISEESNLNNNNKNDNYDGNNNQNKDETQQLNINNNDTDKSPLNSDRSNNNTSSKSLLNKPFSFYMTHADPKEVEDSLNSLMTHNTQPIEQLRDPVMQLINRKKLDALIDRDYDLAEKYDQTAEILQQSGDDLLFERNERIRKLTIDDRADTISEKKNNIQQKYNSKIEELKNERKTALENIQSQQENENAAFRQKWQDPNFISKYKRPSPELLQLRYVEKKLALSKFYDEAKEKKMWADKQQKIEEKQTQIIIEEEMKKDFFRMKDAQLFQLKKVSDHYDNLIRSLEFQRNKEIQSMEYALKQMEVKKNTVPNRKLHTIPKELSQMNEKITDTSLTAKMSPRTLSKLAKFRIEKKGKINVSPISESTFSKLIATHPIIRPQSKFKVNNHPPSRLRRL